MKRSYIPGTDSQIVGLNLFAGGGGGCGRHNNRSLSDISSCSKKLFAFFCIIFCSRRPTFFAFASIVYLLYISIKSRLKNLFLSFSARNAQHFLPSYRLSSSYTYQENRVSTSRFFVSFSARYPYHFLTSYRLSISYAYRENRVWKQRFLSFSAKDVQHFLPLYRLTISYTYRENWLKNIFFTDLSLFK